MLSLPLPKSPGQYRKGASVYFYATSVGAYLTLARLDLFYLVLLDLCISRRINLIGGDIHRFLNVAFYIYRRSVLMSLVRFLSSRYVLLAVLSSRDTAVIIIIQVAFAKIVLMNLENGLKINIRLLIN